MRSAKSFMCPENHEGTIKRVLGFRLTFCLNVCSITHIKVKFSFTYEPTNAHFLYYLRVHVSATSVTIFRVYNINIGGVGWRSV